MEIVIIILGTVTGLFAIIGYFSDDESLLKSVGYYCVFFLVFGFISGGLFAIKNGEEPIVIERSQSCDWRFSSNQLIKRDTMITQIKVNKGDTLYPTTEYKVIKRK